MHKLRRFGFNAIKESFDRLPTAVCFFDRSGGIVLCNRQMYRLSQPLLRSDLQYMGELEEALAAPPEGVTPLEKMENTYRFPDGTVWKFEKTGVTDRYGTSYIQFTAADVTALHWALIQLAEDNRALERDAERMRRLSENVEAVAREKEQLAAKSAMHDSLAACITVTKQYLAGDLHGVDGEAVLREWEKSISFRDALRLPAKETLYENARSSGVTVRVRGPEPVGAAAELLYAAMQVCLSNAVQYAQATELTAHIWEDGDKYNILIRNNRFDRVNPIGRYPNENSPDIYINSYLGTDPSLRKSTYPIIRDVWITGNEFIDSTGSPVYVCTADNVTVSGNRFVNRSELPVKSEARGAIGVSDSGTVRILNNVWESSLPGVKSGLLYDADTVKQPQFGGNTVK